MQRRARDLLALILLSVNFVFAANFTFDYGAATQCNDFNVSWSGGSAPFSLTIIPVFGMPVTHEIPSSSYSGEEGTFQTQLTNIPENHTVLAVMSDAGGFGTGGVSEVIAVGAGSSSCNTTLQTTDYYFDTPLSLDQCRLYEFSNYANAIQPVNITGVIPGGSTFELLPSSGDTTFEWTADLASGTSVLFFMVDADGNQGGSTQVNQVGVSDESSCLTGTYPSSLAAHPSLTGTASSSATATSITDDIKSTSGGTIAGAVIGSAVGVAGLLIALYFFLQHRRSNRKYAMGGTYVYDSRGKRNESVVDLAHESDEITPPAVISPFPFYAPTTNPAASGQPLPPGSTVGLVRLGSSQPGAGPHSAHDTFNTPPSQTHTRQHSQTDTGSFELVSRTHDSTISSARDMSVVTGTSAASRKAAMAGVSSYQNQPAPRFILHADAEDVIELPPQYSALRVPSVKTADTSSGDAATVTDMSTPIPSREQVPNAGVSQSAASGILDESMADVALQVPLAPSLSPLTGRPTPNPWRDDEHAT